MKICLGNRIEEIKNIVKNKAKFQKVMLIFDENVSNTEIGSIYEEIKDICVYNQYDISRLDESEIFNGYRLIIYLCSATNYMKCNFEKDEFINVFVPQNIGVLPFMLTNSNRVSNYDSYFVLNSKQIDLNMLSSIHLNSFYNYFNFLLSGKISDVFIDSFENKPITQQNMFEFLEFNNEMIFIDMSILKECNISYDDIYIIDLMIIDIFLLLISKIKNGDLMFVDVYKLAKSDLTIVDRFYKFFQNENFINMIMLNYKYLYNNCIKTRNKILELSRFFETDLNKVETLTKKIEEFAQNDNEILGLAYFYNVFNF